MNVRNLFFALLTSISIASAQVGPTLQADAVGTITVLADGSVICTRPTSGEPVGIWDIASLQLNAQQTLHVEQPSAHHTLVVRVHGVFDVDGTVSSNGRLVLIGLQGGTLSESSTVTASQLTVTALDFSEASLRGWLPVKTELPRLPPTSALRFDCLGALEATGAEGRATTPGNLRLMAHRLVLRGSSSVLHDGQIVVLAGLQVQTDLGNYPLDFSDVVVPIDPSLFEGALIDSKQSGGGNGIPMDRKMIAKLWLTPEQYATWVDSVVIHLGDGYIPATRSIVIDCGNWGVTLLDGTTVTTTGPYNQGCQLDVFGGKIHLKGATVSSTNDGVVDAIRVGGDENNLGATRADGPGIAYSTFIDKDSSFEYEPNELHVTGYSVLTEGTLPILLLSGHDGDVEADWLLDRRGVYGVDDNDDSQGASGFMNESIRYNHDTDVAQAMDGLVAAMQQQSSGNRRPSTLTFRLRRIYVDVNRRSGSATGKLLLLLDDRYGYGDNPENQLAYDQFHTLIALGEQLIEQQFGKGIMLDLHGHDDGEDLGPVQIGHRIHLDAMLADATFPNAPTVADFGSPVFRDLLNNTPEGGALNNPKSSSVIQLARDLAEDDNSSLRHLWEVIFGASSLYQLFGNQLDGNDVPYRTYVVDDLDNVDGIDYDFPMRVGDYIQRRHSSSVGSPDCRQTPGNTMTPVHDGFVEEVDGIQLELPQEYRFEQDADYLNEFREDMARAILQFVENNYGLDVLP